MTAEQFEALATLLRLRDGPQREAARLHLVDGLARPLAAATAGCKPGKLHDTLQVIKRGVELVAVAAGRS